MSRACAKREELVAHALSQRAALDIVTARPELLHELIHGEGSWCGELAQVMTHAGAG